MLIILIFCVLIEIDVLISNLVVGSKIENTSSIDKNYFKSDLYKL